MKPENDAKTNEQQMEEKTNGGETPETPEKNDSDQMKLLEESISEIEEMRAEAEAAKEKLLRAAAEYENYKKRAEREKQEAMKFIAESIVLDLLPIIDNLDRAIRSASQNSDSMDALLEGITMVHKQMLAVLEKHGVKPIEAHGKPFDPNFHDALMQVESDEHPENTVVEEFERGYMLHDKVIRPAKVIVSAKPRAEGGDIYA